MTVYEQIGRLYALVEERLRDSQRWHDGSAASERRLNDLRAVMSRVDKLCDWADSAAARPKRKYYGNKWKRKK